MVRRAAKVAFPKVVHRLASIARLAWLARALACLEIFFCERLGIAAPDAGKPGFGRPGLRRPPPDTATIAATLDRRTSETLRPRAPAEALLREQLPDAYDYEREESERPPCGERRSGRSGRTARVGVVVAGR